MEAGLKVNSEKSFFGRTETENIGFWVSNDLVTPLSSKVGAIKAIYVPTKIHDLQKFVVIVDYYRDIWRRRAHTLAPLTKICSTEVKFKWTDVEKNYFIAMENKVGQGVLLYYPNFSKSL